jgi:small GTP-binding protein
MAFNQEKSPTYIFKLVLIGSGGVGKTCIARRLCFNTFDANTQMTIGIDFYTYDIPIIVNGEETTVRHTIWDFGGQEQFKKLFSYYIDGSNGIFLVFELIDMESLTRLSWWYDRIVEHNLRDHPKILIGTKSDLVQSANKKQKVDELIIQQFLAKHDVKDYVRTSSKEDINILHSFKEITRNILDYNSLSYDEIP